MHFLSILNIYFLVKFNIEQMSQLIFVFYVFPFKFVFNLIISKRSEPFLEYFGGFTGVTN